MSSRPRVHQKIYSNDSNKHEHVERFSHYSYIPKRSRTDGLVKRKNF